MHENPLPSKFRYSEENNKGPVMDSNNANGQQPQQVVGRVEPDRLADSSSASRLWRPQHQTISNSSNHSIASNSHSITSHSRCSSSVSQTKSQYSTLTHTSFHDLKNAWETKSQASRNSNSRSHRSRRSSAAASASEKNDVDKSSSGNHHSRRRTRAREQPPSSSKSYASQLYGRNGHGRDSPYETTTASTTASGNENTGLSRSKSRGKNGGRQSTKNGGKNSTKKGNCSRKGSLARQYDDTLSNSKFLRQTMDSRSNHHSSNQASNNAIEKEVKEEEGSAINTTNNDDGRLSLDNHNSSRVSNPTGTSSILDLAKELMEEMENPPRGFLATAPNNDKKSKDTSKDRSKKLSSSSILKKANPNKEGTTTMRTTMQQQHVLSNPLTSQQSNFPKAPLPSSQPKQQPQTTSPSKQSTQPPQPQSTSTSKNNKLIVPPSTIAAGLLATQTKNLPPPPPELNAFLSSPTGLNWEDLVRSLQQTNAAGGGGERGGIGGRGKDALLDCEIEVKVYENLREEDEISELGDGGWYDSYYYCHEDGDTKDTKGYVGDNQFLGDVVTNYFEEKEVEEAGALWNENDDDQYDSDKSFVGMGNYWEFGGGETEEEEALKLSNNVSRSISCKSAKRSSCLENANDNNNDDVQRRRKDQQVDGEKKMVENVLIMDDMAVEVVANNDPMVGTTLVISDEDGKGNKELKSPTFATSTSQHPSSKKSAALKSKSISRMDSLEKRIERVVTEQQQQHQLQQPDQSTTATTSQHHDSAKKKILPLSPPPRKSYHSISPRRRRRQLRRGNNVNGNNGNNQEVEFQTSIGSSLGSAFSPVKAPIITGSPTTPGTVAMETSFDSYSTTTTTTSTSNHNNILSPATAQSCTSRKSIRTTSPIEREDSMTLFSPIERHPNSPQRTSPPQPVSPKARRSPRRNNNYLNSNNNNNTSSSALGIGHGTTTTTMASALWVQDVHVPPRLPPRVISSRQQLRHHRHGRYHCESPSDPPIILSFSMDEASACSPRDELLKHAELDPPLMMPLSSYDANEDEDEERDLEASNKLVCTARALNAVYEGSSYRYGEEIDANKDDSASIFEDLVVAGSSERYEEEVEEECNLEAGEEEEEEEEDSFYNQIRGGGATLEGDIVVKTALQLFHEQDCDTTECENDTIAPFPTCWNSVRDTGDKNDKEINVSNNNAQNDYGDEVGIGVDKVNSNELQKNISKNNSVSNSNTTERTISSSSTAMMGPLLILPQTLSTNRKDPTCWQIARHRIRRTKGEF